MWRFCVGVFIHAIEVEFRLAYILRLSLIYAHASLHQQWRHQHLIIFFKDTVRGQRCKKCAKRAAKCAPFELKSLNQFVLWNWKKLREAPIFYKSSPIGKKWKQSHIHAVFINMHPAIVVHGLTSPAKIVIRSTWFLFPKDTLWLMKLSGFKPILRPLWWPEKIFYIFFGISSAFYWYVDIPWNNTQL